MSDNNSNSLYRKKEMKEQGLLEIPMQVDSSRYLINNIRWADVLYTAPFLLITAIILYFLSDTGNLSSTTIIFSFLPPTIVSGLLWVKHSDRKNVSLVTVFKWRLQFMRSKKKYEMSRERVNDMKEDIRSQLGIWDINNDCFETLDNHFVKVVEVSSVNLTGMSNNDRLKTLNAYQSFLNNHSFSSFPLQIEQFSRPVNLKSYLQWVEKISANEKDIVKRLLNESYIKKTLEIQKSKKMVSKARYIIVREKIGTSRENSLNNITRKAETLVAAFSGMLPEKHKLHASTLDNEELFDLIYSAIDYENAQISQGMRNNSKALFNSITLGNRTHDEIVSSIEEERLNTIY